MHITTEIWAVNTNDQTGKATATDTIQGINFTSNYNLSLNDTSINNTLDLTSDNTTEMWYFIIDVILILPTLFGNSLIIISLIRFKSLRKMKAFILIGNLAVSDLLVGCVVIPLDLVLILSPIDSNKRTLCMWFYCAVYTLATASVLNLLLLSLERYHAIIKPFQHNATFTNKRIYYCIGIIWILVLIIGSIPRLVWGEMMNDINGSCRNNIVFDSTYKMAVNTLIITALVTSFVLFIVVTRIAISKSQTHSLNVMGDANAVNDGADNVKLGQHSLRRDIRHTRLMIIISGTFVICWAPYCIASVIPSQKAEVALVRNCLASLGFINSCLNWIIYAARNSKFRAAFKSILNCSCRQRGEINIVSSTSRDLKYA